MQWGGTASNAGCLATGKFVFCLARRPDKYDPRKKRKLQKERNNEKSYTQLVVSHQTSRVISSYVKLFAHMYDPSNTKKRPPKKQKPFLSQFSNDICCLALAITASEIMHKHVIIANA